MKIEIAVQCHFYQRRMCWMMSSILQQIGRTADIIFNCAYVEGTGNPTSKACLDFFSKRGLTVKHTPYNSTEKFQFRGLTRNRQVKESEADWIIFADSDVVYPPNFFSEFERLMSGEHKDESMCMGGPRSSSELEPTLQMVDPEIYPCIIENTWDKYDYLPKKFSFKRAMGAGYCQIINVNALRSKHDGLYQPEDMILDSGGNKWWKTNSDKHFRGRVGFKPINLPLQGHLQHVRDLDYNKHTEEQR